VDINAWKEQYTSIFRIPVISLKDQYPPTRLFSVKRKKTKLSVHPTLGLTFGNLLKIKTTEKTEPIFPG
jgi:hypothetical protein